MTNPVKKKNKNSSHSNHLMPSEETDQKAKGLRSKSTSNITKEKEQGFSNDNTKKLQEAKTCHNHVNGRFPPHCKKSKAVPPKRPPPPTVLPDRYKNRTYANWYRSSSESDLSHMYANFPESYLENNSFRKSEENLNIYCNEIAFQAYESMDSLGCNQTCVKQRQSVDDTYILMSAEDDVDENGYMTMSTERN